MFHFTLIFTYFRYALIWCKEKSAEIITYLSNRIWNQASLAAFFAYFLTSDRPCSQDILYLICCPYHLRGEVKQELKGTDTSPSVPNEVHSTRDMTPDHDKAFVFVSGGISPVNRKDMQDFHLR